MVIFRSSARFQFLLFLIPVLFQTNNVAFASLREPHWQVRSEEKESQLFLKVYVLAGQSNMEGHGEVATMNTTTQTPLNGTLLYQVLHPRTSDEFSILWNTSGWSSWPNIQVWFNEAGGEDGVNGSNIPGVNNVDYSAGDLTVGFGSGGPAKNHNNLFGPELGFGVGLNMSSDENVLIIKTAWGGKNLAVDFRPPSSTVNDDPYCQLPDCDPYQVGHFYKVMLHDVRQILANLDVIFPQFSNLIPIMSGFGWHQGWNDGCDLNQTAAYEQNLVNLIQDLRREWNSAFLPISIAVSGFGGFQPEQRQPPDCFDDDSDKLQCDCGAIDHGCRRLNIIESQYRAANMTRHHKRIKCCVVVTETRGFWREAKYSPSNQNFHWNHNAESHFLIGKALAEGIKMATAQSPFDATMAMNLQNE